MTVSVFVSWLLCGLVVGLIARALVPGRQRMGLLPTTVLGIVGSLAGGLLYAFVRGAPAEPFSLTGDVST